MIKDSVLKLMTAMRNAYEILESRGLTDDILRKAKFICPDLLQKSYALQDKIDTIFLRDQDYFGNPEKWDKFVMDHVLPWFECWLLIINSVSGSKHSTQELVK